MKWIVGIAFLAFAALVLAFVTDARLTKCSALTVPSIIGLCTPEAVPEPSGTGKRTAPR